MMLSDYIWYVLLAVILFANTLTAMLYGFHGKKVKAIIGGLYGLVFIWLIVNVSRLNKGFVLEMWVFVASILPLFVIFSDREMKAMAEGHKRDAEVPEQESTTSTE